LNIQSKTATILIATLLILSMATTMMLIPTASAATKTTFAYVQALPDHVGVGDDVTIYMWIDKTFPGALLTNDYRFHNFQLTITKPDNTTETKTWETVIDTTSNQAYVYTPTQTGTYTLKFNFPQTLVNATSHPLDATANDVYLASSATATFTVQQESIGQPIATYPLPTEYWTRPIYGENSIWFLVSSNWLGTGAPGYGGFAGTYNFGGNGMLYPDDAIGPETSHIMWTKPLQSGGVVGGDNFDGYEGNTYFEGSAYIQRYQNPIIVNGKIYYTEPMSYTSASGGPTTCVDLRTGEEIWSRTDVPALSFALIFDPEDPNQHGVYNALLIAASGGGFFGGASSWRAFDADTGNPLFNVTNAPGTGRKAMGPMGEFLMYQVLNSGTSQNPSWNLMMWNSTRLWTGATGIDTSAISGSIDGAASSRYTLNVSIPWANPGQMAQVYAGFFGPPTLSTPFTIVEAYYNDIMLCYNGTLPSSGTSFFFGATETFAPYTYFAVNLNPEKGTVGSVLWSKTYTPTINATIIQAGVDPVNRVFVENIRELQAFNGYDLDTGAKLWSTIDYPQVDMDYYGSPASGSLSNMFAYGKMYSSGYGGIVYCYDTTSGDLLWTYGNGGAGNSTDGGMAVPGNYPTFVNAYGNGLIYLVTTEHTIETPLFKGALCRAINATDGTEAWTINGYVGEFMTNSYAIADGYATWFNGLDNQIYVVGRGASQTTVSAPQAAIEFGRSLIISGSVTDLSSGTTQDEQSVRFPSGVACASDASMKDWMGYVYQQKPLPSNFTGVEVTLNVLDANGNFRTIGTTTTDASGMYAYQWTPDIEGKYTVIATFAGTKGYWPSYAETAFAVDPAAATPAPTATPVQSMADLYFVPAIVGLLVAIIVVGLLIILVLRKRP